MSLLPYQVDGRTQAVTGNADVKSAHCLQALHDRRTRLGPDLFDRAGNRPHTIKAVLAATLED
ncbi:hypothetical protein [Streptomyces sp. ADMS]|uniref:hypothetical protein n=1 Tax=Streptomyces sp. ADMS TaxID=3071415 RepID=UPI003995FBFE